MRESLATHRGLRNAASEVQRVLMCVCRPAMDTAQAQRVTADSQSRSGPLTGGPDWPLARPGGIGGVAAPVPPGQLLFARKRARRVAGPLGSFGCFAL